MVSDGTVEIKDNAHDRLGLHTLLQLFDNKKTLTTLDNWLAPSRITDKGKKEFQLINKTYYDTENA